MFLQMRNGRENMLVIYLFFSAVRRFLLSLETWQGGEVGDSNTCSKMPFLPQKLAA